jgi:hypothetical protein
MMHLQAEDIGHISQLIAKQQEKGPRVAKRADNNCPDWQGKQDF